MNSSPDEFEEAGTVANSKGRVGDLLPVPLPHYVTPEMALTSLQELKQASRSESVLSDDDVANLVVHLATVLSDSHDSLGSVQAALADHIDSLTSIATEGNDAAIDAITEYLERTADRNGQRIGAATGQLESYLSSLSAENAVKMSLVPSAANIPLLRPPTTPGETPTLPTGIQPVSGTLGRMSRWTDLHSGPPEGAAAVATNGPYSQTGLIYAWSRPATGDIFAAYFRPGENPGDTVIQGQPTNLSEYLRYGPYTIDRFTWGTQSPEINSVWSDIPGTIRVLSSASQLRSVQDAGGCNEADRPANRLGYTWVCSDGRWTLSRTESSGTTVSVAGQAAALQTPITGSGEYLVFVSLRCDGVEASRGYYPALPDAWRWINVNRIVPKINPNFPTGLIQAMLSDAPAGPQLTFDQLGQLAATYDTLGDETTAGKTVSIGVFDTNLVASQSLDTVAQAAVKTCAFTPEPPGPSPEPEPEPEPIQPPIPPLPVPSPIQKTECCPVPLDLDQPLAFGHSGIADKWKGRAARVYGGWINEVGLSVFADFPQATEWNGYSNADLTLYSPIIRQ